MTPRQKEIGDKLLQFLARKGQANTDEYFHHLTRECQFNDWSDQGAIGMVKAELLTLDLIEQLGQVDNYIKLTPYGVMAEKTGIAQWMARKQFRQERNITSKEKRIAILKGLYERKFDGKIYDLRPFLPTATLTELYQIAKALENDGLIKMVASKDSVHGEITLSGVEVIDAEETDLAYQPKDKFNPDESRTLKAKIDELGDRLSRMEVGQQITYDDLIHELEELKKLVDVLGKKNWLQILKGKLVDAGFGVIADQVSELIIEIFKEEKFLKN
ncbi:hypothetical protein [Chryseolinea sp. H1M3-3]|uniref:hypothetical protein n=1 Tax=Chryseolinea sp. H1M3-3 TaxID=3034144 RepID=UPI0023EE27E2|nr:hypothetical protein [Chryseolinea sp. H1M3-3]